MLFLVDGVEEVGRPIASLTKLNVCLPFGNLGIVVNIFIISLALYFQLWLMSRPWEELE